MSFNDEIASGFAEAQTFIGEAFTISGRLESFSGIFRGEMSPVSFDLQGFDSKPTNQLSSNKDQFSGIAPLINQRLTKATGEIYSITGIEAPDGVSYDFQLQKVDA